jgi:7-carboxy-7-deazaguanine synthase
MSADPELVIHEIYRSLQGESTWAGLPFVIVRLTGCPLRCAYCDTTHAYEGGERLRISAVVAKVRNLGDCHVLVTGGEPLAQADAPVLLKALCDAGCTVLLETAGSHDVSGVDERVHLILDLKTPGSGETARNLWNNLEHLRADRDELKFVLTGREDYDWAKTQIVQHGLARRVRAILFSPAFEKVPYPDLARWILEDRLPPPVRFHLQLHKLVWGPEARGV